MKVSFVIFGRESCERSIIPQDFTTEQGKTTDQHSDRTERPKLWFFFSFFRLHV